MEKSCCQIDMVQKLVFRNWVSARTHVSISIIAGHVLKSHLHISSRFKQPYPQTHWCPIPFEDKTNKPLCRPLPADRMAPPVSRVEQPGDIARFLLRGRSRF